MQGSRPLQPRADRRKALLSSDRRPPQLGQIERAVTDARIAALSFDDGPGERTADLAARLEAAGARASFFVVGENIASHESTLRGLADAGHEIGNHSWSHRPLTDPGADARGELERTSAAITAATSASPTSFRPPFGILDEPVVDAAAELGMATVTWDVDPKDWREASDPAEVADHVVGAVEPGSIVLLHEDGPATLGALDAILGALDLRGFELVPVSELLSRSGLRG